MSGTRLQYNAPVDFRIAQTPPDDIPPEYRVAFSAIYNSIQQVIRALTDNCGIGPQSFDRWSQLAGSPSTLLSGNLNRLYVEASEDIDYGAAITLYNAAGTLTCRNANATDATKPAKGFCTTSGGIAALTPGEVQITTGVAAISGLTPGAPYFLSTTNGLITNVPAVGAGNIEQYIGFAISTDALAFNTGYWIQH